MSVEAQVAVTPVPPLTLPARPAIDPASYFHRVWPPIALAIGLIVTAGWISLLAYGLFELREVIF
jgi:hypothetical protein